MRTSRESLFDSWDFLQERVVPSLRPGHKRQPARVWSLGSPADAIAVTVAMSPPHSTPTTQVRTFAPLSAFSPGSSTFQAGDLKRLPPERRQEWFAWEGRRFHLGTAITEAIVLAEPVDPVDLVVLDSAAVDPATPTGVRVDLWRRAAAHLRHGGYLLANTPQPQLVEELRQAEPSGRLFRSEGRAQRRRPNGSTHAEPAANGAGAPTLARHELEQDLFESHAGLARSLAHRFGYRGESVDDLEQVALLALVQAARRFDPDREVKFSTYATASILGAIKRHFRDRGWMMRVPRSVQERYLSVKQVRDALVQELGSVPTVEEIAKHLGASEEDVLDALEAGQNYLVAPLELPDSSGQEPNAPATIDPAFDRVLDRHQLVRSLPQLDDRQQAILKRRFFDGWTQQQIADELHVSQMHISRLLAQALTALRAQFAQS
jgi:RNA polymerase sigma-B factor